MAMAAFPVVALDTAQLTYWIVIVITTYVSHSCYHQRIVAGHDHQCVVGNGQLIQRFHEFADDMVELENEIIMGTG